MKMVQFGPKEAKMQEDINTIGKVHMQQKDRKLMTVKEIEK